MGTSRWTRAGYRSDSKGIPVDGPLVGQISATMEVSVYDHGLRESKGHAVPEGDTGIEAELSRERAARNLLGVAQPIGFTGDGVVAVVVDVRCDVDVVEIGSGGIKLLGHCAGPITACRHAVRRLPHETAGVLKR